MFKKPLVLLLLTIVIISIALQFLLHSRYLSEKLIEATTNGIEQVTGGHASIIRARLNLAPTFIEYEDFSLRQSERDFRAVRVERIRVSLSFFSLLTDTVFIRKISLENPVIRLIEGEFPLDAPLPVREPSPTSESSDKPRFLIRELDINNGNFLYEFAVDSSRIESHRINLNIRPSLKMDRFDTTVTADAVEWSGPGEKRRIESVNARAVVRAGRADIERLMFSSLGSSFNGKGSVINFRKPEIALTGDATIPLEGLHTVLPETTPYAGTLRISGKFTGVWPDISIGGNIDASDLSFRNISIGKVQAAFLYESRKVVLSNIRSVMFAGQVTGSAGWSLHTLTDENEQNDFDFSLNVRDLDLREVLISLGKPAEGIRHRATGQIAAEGRYSREGIDVNTLAGQGDIRFYRREVDRATADMTQQGSDFRFRLLSSIREGNARFTIREGQFLISEGMATTAGTSVSFGGEIERSGNLRLDVDLETADVAEIMNLMVPDLLGGGVAISGRLTGTPSNPVFNGSARARNFSLRGESFDTVETGIFYKEAGIRFNEAELVRDESRYHLSGSLDFSGPAGERPAFDLSGQVIGGSPHHIIPMFTRDLPVVVPLTGTITAGGTPKKFLVRGTLEAGTGTIYGQKLDAGQLKLEISRKQIAFKKTTARIGESVVKGEGVIRFDGNFEFSAQSNYVNLQDIAPVQSHLDFLRGPVSGSFIGRGTLKRPVFDADLKLVDVAWSGHPLGPGRAKGLFEYPNLTATGALEAGLTGRARLKWEEGFPFEFDLGFNKMNLLSWFAASVPGLTNLSHLKSTGSVNGKGRFRTSSSTVAARSKLPVDMTARVELEGLSVGFKDYILLNKTPVNLTLRGETATIESFEFQGQGTALTVSGNLVFFKSYDVIVSGEADLNLLRTFTQEFSYGSGQGRLALTVKGNWENPEFRGSLSVSEGGLTSTTLKQPLDILALEMTFNRHLINLDVLEVGYGGGLINARGDISLVGFLPDKFSLKVEAENIGIKLVEGLSANLDAAFDFRGDADAQSLLGEIRILNASYKRRIDFRTWVKEMFGEKPRPEEGSPLLRNVSLRVSISGDENIGIENNLAQIPLETDLGVKGTLDRPQFAGHVSSRGGKFSFQGSEFTIQNGVVEFGTGETEGTRTRIDLQAKTRIREYDIGLSLVGPLSRPELTFTSNPPLKDQNEILCLLISRRPCEELKENSRAYGAAQASRWLSDEIENLISDKFGELPTNVDVDTSAISFRKTFLDEKLQVTYASSFDATKEPEVFLEYFVSNNVSLYGGSDEEGKVGADLKFHLEFR